MGVLKCTHTNTHLYTHAPLFFFFMKDTHTYLFQSIPLELSLEKIYFFLLSFLLLACLSVIFPLFQPTLQNTHNWLSSMLWYFILQCHSPDLHHQSSSVLWRIHTRQRHLVHRLFREKIFLSPLMKSSILRSKNLWVSLDNCKLRNRDVVPLFFKSWDLFQMSSEAKEKKVRIWMLPTGVKPDSRNQDLKTEFYWTLH